MEFSYRFISNYSFSHDNRLVEKHIIIIRFGKNDRVRDKSKIQAFLMMHKILVKNIDNFNYLAKKYGVNKEELECFSKDDLILEAFEVFNKCSKNFKLFKKYDFYWFFNKAVERCFLRLVKKFKNNSSHTANIDSEFITDTLGDMSNMIESDIDYASLDFEFLKFTRREKSIALSKIKGEKVQAYLKKSKLSQIEYYEILKSIKQKLNDEQQRVNSFLERGWSDDTNNR